MNRSKDIVERMSKGILNLIAITHDNLPWRTVINRNLEVGVSIVIGMEDLVKADSPRCLVVKTKRSMVAELRNFGHLLIGTTLK